MLKSLRDQVYGCPYVFAYDCIGMVDIHPLCYRLINLPEFQRLRDIKQLNNLHYIYPGATHDRFVFLFILKCELGFSTVSVSIIWQKYSSNDWKGCNRS